MAGQIGRGPALPDQENSRYGIEVFLKSLDVDKKDQKWIEYYSVMIFLRI